MYLVYICIYASSTLLSYFHQLFFYNPFFAFHFCTAILHTLKSQCRSHIILNHFYPLYSCIIQLVTVLLLNQPTCFTCLWYELERSYLNAFWLNHTDESSNSDWTHKYTRLFISSLLLSARYSDKTANAFPFLSFILFQAFLPSTSFSSHIITTLITTLRQQ